MRRTLLFLAAAGAALVLPAGSALAHVTVNPKEVPGGGYAKLAFRVPNERDNASTTKVEINFPEEHPFSSVTVRPLPGWTYTVERRTLTTPIDNHGNQISEAVARITWTGGSIKPGEFEEFEVSVGRLPTDVDSIAFKALQTYSNGEVVRWIEVPAPGGSEPERPAPVLQLTTADSETGTAAPAGSGDAGSQAQGGAVDDEGAATKNVASKRDVDRARLFGLLGLAFGVVALVTTAAVRRKPPSAS